MKHNNGRGFLLASGVIDLINTLCLLGIAVLFVTLGAMWATLDEDLAKVFGIIGMIAMFIIAAILAVMTIFGIVYTAVSFSMSKQPVAKAKLKKGVLMVFGILALIVAVACLASIISMATKEESQSPYAYALSAVELVMVLLSGIFKLIAYKRINDQTLSVDDGGYVF